MDASISKSEEELMALQTAADSSRSTSAIVSEGVLGGFVAAAAVALLFFVLDTMAGEPLKTPRYLGTLLLSLFGAAPSASADSATPLAMYTLFHFVAFIIAGVVAAAIVQVTIKAPAAIFLFVILFFAFELAFTGFIAVLDATSAGAMTPLRVALGNIVAAVAMGLFFRARHPRLKTIGRGMSAED